MSNVPVVIIIITTIVSIVIPVLVILLINRKHKVKLWLKISVPIIFTLVVNFVGFLCFFNIYYHATGEVKDYLKDDDEGKVYSKSDYYLFDNISNNNKALIFYGGAKVEEKSYAPMLNKIAHQGYDVFLTKMPLRFPLFAIDKANSIYKANNTYNTYQDVYLMGHSLGGVCAAMALEKTSLNYKGIVFLASYPSKPLDSKYKALSIYGSEDKVLNLNEYNDNLSNFPTDYSQKIIEGGNHAYYGYYGEQKGDGKASITREQQIDITVNYVIDFLEN